MSLILSIETATPVCSVALHRDAIILADSHLFIGQTASSKLAVMVDELLQRCEVQPKELSAIAVSAGPGSYTGLRIGVATAKGMCYALSKPLISINTLESMVNQIKPRFYNGEYFCPMLDARRMEVYSLLTNNEGEMIRATAAEVIDETSYQPNLDDNKIVFFGNGAEKCKHLIQHANAVFVDNVHPSAADIGELSHIKFTRNEFENLAEYEPFYLKDFMVKKPKAEN